MQRLQQVIFLNVSSDSHINGAHSEASPQLEVLLLINQLWLNTSCPDNTPVEHV